MSLADKVATEQAAVTAGRPACGAAHPDGELESNCVRVVHLPGDMVHVGTLSDGSGGSLLIQWEDQ